MKFSNDKHTQIISSAKSNTLLPVMNSLQYQMLKSIRNTIKSIVSESNGILKIQRMHHLNGTFKKICNPSMTTNNTEFADTIFPGTSKEVLLGLPKNLKEILEWNELELDLMKISNNAREVLENIKLKGKSQGDIMDEQSESILLPQIAQEALAKGIIEAVRTLNRKVSQINAKASQPIASPTADEATWDQLETSLVSELFQQPQQHQKVGIQYHFMGQEWTDLIRNDLNRFKNNEKMSLLTKEATTMISVNNNHNNNSDAVVRMTWLENTLHIQENYAALAEALKFIHALPYELNLKSSNIIDANRQSSSGSRLALLTPSKGCTMLLYFPKGSQQTARYDSRDDGSDLDSGIRITCTYFIQSFNDSIDEVQNSMDKNNISSSTNRFNFYRKDNNSSIATDNGNKMDISPLSESPQKRQCTHLVLSQEISDDLLVLHQSTELLNERTVTNAEYFALIFFIHGRPITTTTS